MYRMKGRRAKVLGAVFVLPMGLISTGGAALAATPSTALRPLDSGAQSSRPFTAHVILSGSTLSHTFTPQGGAPATEALSDPDDITLLGDYIFVGFQNGVGPQGQPSTDGNLDSTVVELKMNGDPVAQWDVQGKTDGVTADPQTGDVIATVNEDANSSLYTIDPTAPAGAQVTHYNYNEPLPHFGGTDAISIYRGQILISASAPGTTGAAAPQKTYPAVYSAVLDAADNTATVTPLFFDEDSATVVERGQQLRPNDHPRPYRPGLERGSAARGTLRWRLHVDEPGGPGADLRSQRRYPPPKPVGVVPVAVCRRHRLAHQLARGLVLDRFDKRLH